MHLQTTAQAYPGLVEADVERELDDERHELRRHEMSKLRDEGRQELRAVRFLVRLPAARGLDLLQVRVRAASSPFTFIIVITFSGDNRAGAKENGPDRTSVVAEIC